MEEWTEALRNLCPDVVCELSRGWRSMAVTEGSPDREPVLYNRDMFMESLGLNPERLFVLNSQHGVSCRVVTSQDCLALQREDDPQARAHDLAIVSEPDVYVGVLAADCIAGVIIDPRNHALCVLHAGWRGAEGCIVDEALSELNHYIASTIGGIMNREDLIAVCSPHAAAKWMVFAEMDPDVFQRTIWKKSGFTRALPESRFELRWADVLAHDLLGAGLRSERILWSHEDTVQAALDGNGLFSYRAYKEHGLGTYGNHMLVAGFRS